MGKVLKYPPASNKFIVGKEEDTLTGESTLLDETTDPAKFKDDDVSDFLEDSDLF